MDNRWEELAKQIVQYSTEVSPGQKVWIVMQEIETYPLARAIYAEVIKAGGFPMVEFQSALLERDLMRFGTMEQIAWVPDPQLYGMQWADVYIGLRGARNLSEFAGISQEKFVAHKKSMGTVSAARNQTRWVLVRIPNESFAQQAGMPFDEMMSLFFQSSIKDWPVESVRYHEICEHFQEAQHVRILGFQTDLSFSTARRIYEVAAGHANLPDGEIFTSPVEESVEGVITFEFPGVYGGQLIHGMRLEFADGVVMKATSTSNQTLLDQIISMDGGSNRVGEFGIGVNYEIDRICYDIFFDEKIGGTVHLALGRGYAECGGKNMSSLHWDIIKDLRQEGQIYLDGNLIFEKGKFLI